MSVSEGAGKAEGAGKGKAKGERDRRRRETAAETFGTVDGEVLTWEEKRARQRMGECEG